MEKNMIKLIEITLVLLVLTGIVHIGCTSWVNFQKASLEIEHKKHMFEYELRERMIKVESDSLINESTKKWQNTSSQYWEGRGDE